MQQTVHGTTAENPGFDSNTQKHLQGTLAAYLR